LAADWTYIALVTPVLPLKLAYQAKQRGTLAGYAVLHEVLRALAGWNDKPGPAAFAELKLRYEDLLMRDWEGARLGHYSARLLFDWHGPRNLRKLSAFARELLAGLSRSRRAGFQELPKGVDLVDYPDYFRRNFHWQSEGYLSEQSAELYDALVEFLFLGAASAMRRQAIVPFSEFTHTRPLTPLQVLDIGCGTGTFLGQLATSHPTHAYTGVDLSPFYVAHARRSLRLLGNVSVVQANAEALPFADQSFDVVTSIYLFHELPPRVRRRVFTEMKRVLRPGGLLIVQDSAQLSESSALEFFLRRFPERFHEPFFKHYLQDPLEDLFTEVGFPTPKLAPAFVAKTVWATLPGHSP